MSTATTDNPFIFPRIRSFSTVSQITLSLKSFVSVNVDDPMNASLSLKITLNPLTSINSLESPDITAIIFVVLAFISKYLPSEWAISINNRYILYRKF